MLNQSANKSLLSRLTQIVIRPYANVCINYGEVAVELCSISRQIHENVTDFSLQFRLGFMRSFVFVPQCPVWCHRYGTVYQQKRPENTQNGGTVLQIANLTADFELESTNSHSSFLVTIRLSRLVSEIFTCEDTQTDNMNHYYSWLLQCDGPANKLCLMTLNQTCGLFHNLYFLLLLECIAKPRINHTTSLGKLLLCYLLFP